MENIIIQEINQYEIRIIENAFKVNDELYDLILKKSGEVFSILIKDTHGKIHFHEQEISEQLRVSKPTLDHLIQFILAFYKVGLNLRKTRDVQIKLLVEGCPGLFPLESYSSYPIATA